MSVRPIGAGVASGPVIAEMTHGWNDSQRAGALALGGLLRSNPVLVGIMIVLSWLLGQRHHDRATGEPYESGILPTGSARLRLSVNFYLVAVFFVIFDLESAFLFAWALCVRQAGWTGYLDILIFIGILMAALAYLWREGALDWGTGQR